MVQVSRLIEPKKEKKYDRKEEKYYEGNICNIIFNINCVRFNINEKRWKCRKHTTE